MEELTDDEVKRLLPLLSARSRAAQGTSSSFRPPQTGIVELVASDWHHFVVGRRGVGKSMLLLTVKEHAAQRGQPAAYIDIETHRDNPYPDVLIQLLITLTATLEDNLKALKLKGGLRLWGRRRGARRQLRALRARLDGLLKEPQQAIHQLNESNARRARRGRDATAKGGVAPTPGVQLSAGVGVSASSSAETTSARAAEYTRTKLDGLRAEAVE